MALLSQQTVNGYIVYYKESRTACIGMAAPLVRNGCTGQIGISAPLGRNLHRAEEIQHTSNIKYKDSIHLACAESANADVLLTTDKKFSNNCQRITTYTKVMNPNEWLLEVLY